MGFPYHSGSLKTDWDDKMQRRGDGFADSSSHDDTGSDRGPAGSGTEISGYIESPVEKRCGTCEYLVGGKFCRQETVLEDSEVPDGEKGLKLVDAKNGCCNFWDARGDAPEPPALPTVDRSNERKEEQERTPKVRLTFY